MKIGALIISFIVIVIFPRQLNGADYTTSEIAALTEIAYKSAYYGGEAVYNARAMLGLELLDPEITLRKLKTHTPATVRSISNSLIVYPNPSNGILNIGVADNTIISVCELDGRFIREVNVQNGSINIADLENGLYLLIVKYTSGKEKHQIVNILK